MGEQSTEGNESVPVLRDPVLIAAFSGWNDAAQVATWSVRTLRTAWEGKRFASIDSEDYYVLTESRPAITLTPSGQRHIRWPANDFYGCSLPDAPHDAVLLVGTEPQLRWRSFCREVLAVAEGCGASSLITVGGLLADVPHTVEPRLSGFASAPELLPQLQELNVQLSTYEGPTGIVGALHDAWQVTSRPAFSLWGSVPHYISAAPNPQVTLALLKRIGALAEVPLRLETLTTKAEAFSTQIDEALKQNPEAREYVRQLEQNAGSPVSQPHSGDLIQKLEEFLRDRRPSDEEDG